MKFDWGQVTKAELKNVDERGNPRKPIPPGMYEARLTEVKSKTSKGGAFGVVLTFTILDGEQKGREVRDSLWLTKKDGSPNTFAHANLKQRMLACGLTPEQIQNFKGPEDENDFGDFKLMLGNKAKVETDLEVNPENGTKYAKVRRVYPVEVEG